MARYRTIDGYKSGEPDVGWWRRAIAEGIQYRKQSAMEHRWDTWRSYYRGKWPPNVIPVNLFFRMLRTVVPRIYFRNPSISIVATKPGYEQQVFAQMIERIDNKLIRTMSTKTQLKRMIHNTWMFGTSAGKLGFGAEFTPTPDEFETQAPIAGTNTFNRKVEWNQTVQPNMPWFLSVHPSNLVVPNRLDAWENTPWVATKIRRSISDIKADPRLKNTSQMTGRQLGTDALSKSSDTTINESELWEIRDMRTGKVIIIPSYSCDDVLLYEDDQMQVNARPNIYPLSFNPDDSNFWGVPDSVLLEPQQLEINEVRTLQMRHRRISVVKLLYKSGAIDDDQVERLMNGEVGIGVKINAAAELTDVDQFQLGSIPEALFQADATIQQDVRDLMGFSRNQSGEFAATKSHSAPTALEASIVQAASEIRVDERRDGCADILVSMFEDANVLCFEHWTDDQVVQVMGPDSLPYWVAFKPAMLKAARYEASIEPDSMVPETKEIRRNKAEMVYANLKTNPLIDPQMLTKYYLREQHGVQFDNMMITLQKNAAAGLPGSAPDQPMGVEDFMGMMMKGGGGSPPVA